MCAIIDANVAGDALGGKSEAGEKFIESINSGEINVIIGGKLRKEIDNGTFQRWFRQAVIAGKALEINDDEVLRETERLERDESSSCKSKDHHIIALARVGNARLLYSKDEDLHKDFRNPKLINKPRGQVYSTMRSEAFTETHRKLLKRKDLCGKRG